MNKWLKRIILPLLLLLLLPLLPLQAQAANESVTTEISFTVKNAPGTVVLEAVTKGAPMPAKTSIKSVNRGAFSITFTEPGSYYYTVHQEGENAPGIGYDTDTVYEVEVFIYYDGNGELSAATAFNKKGSATKAGSILFENTPVYANLDIKKIAKCDGEEIEGVFGGTEFLYEISVENFGGAPATNVTITDTLPTELPLLTVGTINDGGRLSADGKSISWTIPYIAPDKHVTVSFTVVVPSVLDETTWVNTARAIYYGGFVVGDTSGSTSTATATASAVVTAPAPDVTIRKKQSLNGAARTEDIIYVDPGDTVTYYLTVTNTGDTVAEDVTVTDAVPNPPLLILDEKSVSHGGTIKNDVITWKLGDMEAGESVTLSFDVEIPEVDEYTVWVNTGFGSYFNDLDPTPGQMHPDRIIMQSNSVDAVYLSDDMPVPPPGGDTPGDTPDPGTPGDKPDPGTPGSDTPGDTPTPGSPGGTTPGDTPTPGENNPDTPGGVNGTVTNDVGGSAANGVNGVKTDDTGHVGIWFILMISAVAGLIVFFLAEKKLRNRRV